MPDAFLPSVLRAADLGGFTTAEEAAYLALQLIIGAADTVGNETRLAAKARCSDSAMNYNRVRSRLGRSWKLCSNIQTSSTGHELRLVWFI